MINDNTIELIEEMLFKISRQMKEEMSYTKDLTYLSTLQIQALVFIKRNKKVSMGDIAEYFCVELPSATSLLNKLFNRKLIKRCENQQDRRLVMITLTSAGETLLKQARYEQRKKLGKILSHLSKKEKIDLLAILETLNNKLQK